MGVLAADATSTASGPPSSTICTAARSASSSAARSAACPDGQGSEGASMATSPPSAPRSACAEAPA
eukprot:7321641-Lingulodinium_polyedra.AAC.1